METWDAIRSRRAVRDYEDRPIPAEHLDRILEAGRRAPSSNNEQPWHFIVVTERDTLSRLLPRAEWAEHVAVSAATVAFLTPKDDDPETRETYHLDLGQAIMSMMLAAADLGIGSAHAWIRSQDDARALLGFPEDRECIWLITFGYPAGRPLQPVANPDRRPFEDVVHRERW